MKSPESIKTINEIYIDAQVAQTRINLGRLWNYCFKWFFISLLLTIFWPGDVSWSLLIIFPIIAIILSFQQLIKLNHSIKNGLDFSGLSDTIDIIDRT